MCLRDWIEPKRSREAGPGLSRGWRVRRGVNCSGVQWVYSDHIQRAFSSRSFKSKCVKGARGGICINGSSWGLWDWGALENEEKRNPPPRDSEDLSTIPSPLWFLGSAQAMSITGHPPLWILLDRHWSSFTKTWRETSAWQKYWKVLAFDGTTFMPEPPAPLACDSGTQYGNWNDVFWASQGDTGAFCKSPLRPWPKSCEEEDGILVNISWDACPRNNEAQTCTMSFPNPDLWEQRLSGHLGSFPEQEISVLHSIYPPAHSLPKEVETSSKLFFCKQFPTFSSSTFPWIRAKTWCWWKK